MSSPGLSPSGGTVPATGKLDRDVLKVAAVVVLGSIMAILDTTVVNVALQELTLQFKTSFDTIQWISTVYMLALATVIPVTGWASDRFGTNVSFFGVMLLFPTYFLLVRGESALTAGLLMAPQGIGAMLTMPVAGKLADRIGAGKVILPGIMAISAGLLLFADIGADTPYWQLLTALFVIGLGVGAAMMPIMVAALQTIQHKDVARASTATNIIQQMFGAIGSAVMSIILAAVLAAKFGVPTSQGQLAAADAIAQPASHDNAALAAADSFATAFTWGLVLMVACAVPTLLLLRRGRTGDDALGETVPAEAQKTSV